MRRSPSTASEVFALRAAVDALALARPLDAVSSSLLVSPAPGAVRARRAWSQRPSAKGACVCACAEALVSVWVGGCVWVLTAFAMLRYAGDAPTAGVGSRCVGGVN
eukprot:344484-Prymnesium_polylepis.1